MEPGQLNPRLLDAAVELMGRCGRRGTVRVQGRSMHPTLREGQVLAIDFTADRFSRGDLLVFRKDDLLVVHRFLGRTRFPDGRPSLRLRGDGVPTFDPHVHPSQVVGKVVALQDDADWRSVGNWRGRVYGRCIAAHDFFWACLSVAGRNVERAPGVAALGLPLGRWVAAVDRRLMGLAHRMLFRRAYPRIPADEALPPQS